uniref:CASP8-associated protein 2 n=1 Tax=Salvator merianae TaxID=96440 RepID=A0A8D0KHT5_SALMN
MATDVESDGMTFSNLLSGISSCREGDDDESSVDIYDGLDSTSVVSIKSTSEVTSTRNNLNLFDELLIEEGAAKEASYNELQAEHKKCQQQLQELMKKFQEIQKQNCALQSENHSLKKNISALIKTARVEINRKDEEISNLQRRLSEVPIRQSSYRRTYFPVSLNNARHAEGSNLKNTCRDLLPENNSQIDPRSNQYPPKDIPRNYPSWDTENKKCNSGKGDPSHIPHSEQLCNEGGSTRLANTESSSEKEKRKKDIKHNEHHARENDSKYKMKAHQNVGSPENVVLDPPGKFQINPEKTVRNGLCKDSKDVKGKSSPCTEKRSEKALSWEKQQVSKNRLHSKTEHSSDDKVEKSHNRNQKDPKLGNKADISNGSRNRESDKYLEQQRTSKISSGSDWNTISQRSKQYNKNHVEDRKMKDCDFRRKGGSDHEHQGRKLSSSPPLLISSREQKHSRSRDRTTKNECEYVNSKSGRHRTEEKRKNEIDNPRETKNTQNERRDSKEASHKTAKGSIKIKYSTKREDNKSSLLEEGDGSEEQMATKAGREEERLKSKDLKLSFMQKLNLTLSPAKKQTDNLKPVAKATRDGDEIPNQDALLVPPGSLGTNTAKETKTTLLIKQEEIISVAEVKLKMGNESLVPSRKPSCPQNIAVHRELADEVKSLPETKPETAKAAGLLTTSVTGSRTDQDTLQDHSFADLETIRSVDFDSYSVIDEINGTDSDSLIEEEESSNCAGEKENKPMPHKASVEDGKILSADVPVTDEKADSLKPDFPTHEHNVEMLGNNELKPTSEAGETNPVFMDDDSSILSIDLNHMRCIPKAISPLNSPVRPLAKVLRMESPYKGPVKSHNTEFTPESVADCPEANQSSELNKENQMPLRTDHQILTESKLSVSSDELEDGEIISDNDEPKIEKNSINIKKRKLSPDRSSLSKITHHHKVRSVPPVDDVGKLSSGKKNKVKAQDGSIVPSKELKKNKAVSTDSCEKIRHMTAEPSTVLEFMQMLKNVRKQVRKSYMKFKIQFPVQHFHRIIDSAILNFTSLVKYVDFSKMSKSSKTLKMNLCEVIEFNLNQVKKNSTIEYLFEQQQSDMKKKLWNFVEEQLDYLFDKIKKILLKLCNLVSFGNESDEAKCDKKMKEGTKYLLNHRTERQKAKKSALITKTQKPEENAPAKQVMGNQLSRKGHHDTSKTDKQKPILTKCKSSCTNDPKHSQTEAGIFKEKPIQEVAMKAGKNEKDGSLIVGDSQKSDISCGPLTEQQMSGLTFNLVNDAQMGEMFKSLLQGSDLSEKNSDFTDNSQWEFRTPEKHIPHVQNYENDSSYEAEGPTPKETQVESGVLDGIKWPVVSPERDSSFLARLQMPIDPDILDESCMFEIPSSPALKKSEECISEKPKSLVSSILLEDLAVSLTIPSPLKSDAHLSFLKPDVLGSVPEDVLSAHFSEDAHLEEEDASEQDIHLALESDNSSSKSSCSSSWANMPVAPGFQYCPNLPMHAVIMEKSNDHFIVKIRRAAPSTSPVLDRAVPAEEAETSVSKVRSSEVMSEEKLDILDVKSVPMEEAVTPRKQMAAVVLKEQVHQHVETVEITNSLESKEELSPCLEHSQVTVLSKPLREVHPEVPETLACAETLFNNGRSEQTCIMPELLQKPHSGPTEVQSTALPGPHQVSHSDSSPEEAPGLQTPPKELESSLECLEESSAKTNQCRNTPEVFKLPQAHTEEVLPKKDRSCAKGERSPVSSAVAVVEEVSSETHFDICIDVTAETPIENEVDSWDLIMEPALGARTGNLSKNKEAHKTTDACATGDLTQNNTAAARNLTESLPDNSLVDDSLGTKAFPTIDRPECQISLNKESRKRRKEIEEASIVKRPRNENSDVACKKNSRSSNKIKDIISATTNASSKKTPDRDPLSSSSLCAKNIIKKKGEVIISWTRNDDREILLDCQRKGPSGKTFASVAVRLNKSPTQVEERFKQLVKLFKMSNCS